MADDAAVHRVRLATGVTLAYSARGPVTGTPVVLLHPWVESRRTFDRLLPLLPDDVRAVAVDQRGHGDAEAPDAGYELASLAADVVAFLDALGVSTAVLLGSSSGGYVAQQVAATSPDRVAGLVLVGSPRDLNRRPPFADEVHRLADPVDPRWVRESLTWFPRRQEVPRWYLEDRVRDGARVPARVWKAALDGLVSARPPTDVGTITAPALVIWGAGDELLGRAEQEELVARIPGSRLVVYPDAGHLVLWEHPGRIAADLVAFLRDLLASAAGGIP